MARLPGASSSRRHSRVSEAGPAIRRHQAARRRRPLMARVLSALVLLPLVIGAVWFLPPIATLALATVAALLAFSEYAAIVAALGARVPRLIIAAAVGAACISVGGGYLSAETILMSAVIVVGALAVASGSPGEGVLRDSAASILPIAYIGLPLG